MLELIEVRKSYPSAMGEGRLEVLKGVQLAVGDGESAAIVGPSGSGKSTLLNIIGGLDRASGGKVLLDGEDMGVLGEKELARIRNERIGFVFQLHHLLPQCTTLENVLIPTLARRDGKGARKAAEERAAGLLERVGMKDWMAHRPGELSGGQRQRVAVVRALINGPKLLLADEPTGSLDKKAAETIMELLVELNKSEKVSLVVVTHSGRLAEKMGRVLELDDGVLCERGSG